jgi:hypothetical protein
MSSITAYCCAEGKPATYVSVGLVPVELMPVDNTLTTNRELHGIGAQADDQGRYEIRGVPPGRYLLGVNLGDVLPGTRMRVEEGGRFTLTAVDGYRYAVQAYVRVIDKNGRTVGYLPAPSVEVIATENTKPVRLVMPPEANCDFLLNQNQRP